MTLYPITIGNPSVPLVWGIFPHGILSDPSTRELRDKGSSLPFAKQTSWALKPIYMYQQQQQIDHGHLLKINTRHVHSTLQLKRHFHTQFSLDKRFVNCAKWGKLNLESSNELFSDIHREYIGQHSSGTGVEVLWFWLKMHVIVIVKAGTDI